MIVILFLVVAASVKVTAGQCERYAAPEVELLNKTHQKGVQSLASGFLRAIGTRVEPADYSSIVNETVAGHAKQAIHKIWQVEMKQPQFAACFAFGIAMVIIMPLVGIGLMCHRYCRCCRRRRDRVTPEGSTTNPTTLIENENVKLSYRLATGLLLSWAFWVVCVGFYYDNSAQVWPHISLVRDGLLNQIDNTAAYFRSLQGESSCLGGTVGDMIAKDVDNLMQTLPNYTTKRVVPMLPTREVDHFFAFLRKMVVTQQNYLNLLLKIDSHIPHLKEYPKIFEDIGITDEKGCNRFALQDIENTQEDIRKVIPAMLTTTAKLNKTIGSHRDLLVEVEKEIKKAVDKERPSADIEVRKARKDLAKIVNMIRLRCSRFIRSLRKARKSLVRAASHEQIQRYVWLKHAINMMILPSLMVLVGVLVASGCGAWSYSEARTGKWTLGKRNAPKGAGILFHAASFATLILGAAIVSATFILFFVGYSAEIVVCEPLFRSRNLTYLEKITRAAGYSEEKGSLTQMLSNCEGNNGIAQAFKDAIPTFIVPKVPVHYGNVFGDVDTYIEKLKEAKDSDADAGGLRKFGRIVESVGIDIDTCRSRAYQAIGENKEYEPLKSQLRYPDIPSYLKKAKKPSDAISEHPQQLHFEASRLSATLSNLKNASNKEKMDEILDDVKTVISSAINNTHDKALQMFMNMGRCRTLYKAYKNIGKLLCGEIVDPVNGMWFSMGMQLLALAPTVVFSMLLSTHFLAMSAQRSRMLEAERP